MTAELWNWVIAGLFMFALARLLRRKTVLSVCVYLFAAWCVVEPFLATNHLI